jgi:hypothetical protein
MKKIFFTTAFFLVVALQQVSAQVPGYQGKRFSIGYNASSFFYFTDLSGGLATLVFSPALSYKTELSANYTVSRKVTMGFSYYFAKQNDYFSKTDFTKNGNNYYNVAPQLGIAQCKLAIYELHFLFFRKNFVAPAGLYHMISVGIVNYSLATPDNKLTIYSTNSYSQGTFILDGPVDPYMCFKLGYAIGKTNPIGHNFFINTSFGINFFRGGDSLAIKTTLTDQNYILANFNRNLRTHNFAEIKIGFGWLAF